MKLQSLLGMILLFMLCQLTVYSQQNTALRSDVDSIEKSLLRTDADFNKLSMERGFVEAFLAYMADSAILFPSRSNQVTGRENIRKHLSEGSENAVLTWAPLKAEVASSADLGYTYGTSEYKSKGEDGKPAVHYGKYVTVWKKQADGSWKFIVDIGNSSPAPESK